MSRLTTYDDFGEVWVDYNQCVNGSRDVLVKLAHYEDLEEQGRLIELPCAVGDTVWVITTPFNITGEIEDFGADYEIIKSYVESVSFYVNGTTQFRVKNIHAYYTENDIGENIFLTKEEAERKLAELKGE